MSARKRIGAAALKTAITLAQFAIGLGVFGALNLTVVMFMQFYNETPWQQKTHEQQHPPPSD